MSTTKRRTIHKLVSLPNRTGVKGPQDNSFLYHTHTHTPRHMDFPHVSLCRPPLLQWRERDVNLANQQRVFADEQRKELVFAVRGMNFSLSLSLSPFSLSLPFCFFFGGCFFYCCCCCLVCFFFSSSSSSTFSFLSIHARMFVTIFIIQISFSQTHTLAQLSFLHSLGLGEMMVHAPFVVDFVALVLCQEEIHTCLCLPIFLHRPFLDSVGRCQQWVEEEEEAQETQVIA